MRIELLRFCSHEEKGTFGELFIDDEHFCYTVESPWKDNKPFVSCVPDGQYALAPFNSPKYSFTYQLVNSQLNVYAQKAHCKRDSDRYACEFHVANYPDNVKGCIGVGEDLGAHCDKWMVTNSLVTMNKLRSVLRSGHATVIKIKTVGGKFID